LVLELKNYKNEKTFFLPKEKIIYMTNDANTLTIRLTDGHFVTVTGNERKDIIAWFKEE
jgi:hypothetical protein